MVVMEGVLSLCRGTVVLFGRLPGIPEGLQVVGVSQVHVRVVRFFCFLFFVFCWVLLCRLFLAVFGDVCCLTSV